MKKIFEQTIYLASKSPRRSYLLEESGFHVERIDIEVDESYPATLDAKDVAEFVARKKAVECLKHLLPDQIGITADTLVALNNRMLEKPKNKAEASQMLLDLGGNNHTVYTGVCICQNDQIDSFTVASDVFLKSLTPKEIDYYIDNYQPYDKAGGYGIQEWIGYAKIARIEGSYSNIMGLPMGVVYERLAKRLDIM